MKGREPPPNCDKKFIEGHMTLTYSFFFLLVFYLRKISSQVHYKLLYILIILYLGAILGFVLSRREKWPHPVQIYTCLLREIKVVHHTYYAEVKKIPKPCLKTTSNALSLSLQHTAENTVLRENQCFQCFLIPDDKR